MLRLHEPAIPAIPLGDITHLLEWFTESEIKTLLGSMMTQAEVNMYVMACRRTAPRGIEYFKQSEQRKYDNARNIAHLF